MAMFFHVRISPLSATAESQKCPETVQRALETKACAEEEKEDYSEDYTDDDTGDGTAAESSTSG